ncbi:MAG: hypothetical protein WBP45_11050 [Daejeonella sp.]
MKLNDDQLTEIERLSGLFMKPGDISTIIGISKSEFGEMLKEQGSPAYQAYYRGKLLSEAEVRKSIITMAKQGSSPAQTLANKLLEDMNIDELDV